MLIMYGTIHVYVYVCMYTYVYLYIHAYIYIYVKVVLSSLHMYKYHSTHILIRCVLLILHCGTLCVTSAILQYGICKVYARLDTFQRFSLTCLFRLNSKTNLVHVAHVDASPPRCSARHGHVHVEDSTLPGKEISCKIRGCRFSTVPAQAAQHCCFPGLIL